MSVQYFKSATQPSFISQAVTVGPVEWLEPFAGETAKVFFRQQFQQDIDSWTALALNTAHGVSTTYLLVREGEFQPIGGGQHRWYRYYACTPPQRVEYSSYAAQFPGVAGGTYRLSIAGTTQAKITLDYFLCSPTSTPSLADESRWSGGGESGPLLSDIVLPATIVSPTSGQYLGFVTTDSSVPTSYSITAEPQTLTRWEGNFYERRTIQVKAK